MKSLLEVSQLHEVRQTCTTQTGESNSHLDVQAIGCTIGALCVRIPGRVMIKSINEGGDNAWGETENDCREG